ncbi:hypothetical protein GIB67_032622 [Kingdonia uniflora]|uniref:Mitochondrial uncoupling protein n=1 Tax=Kingdonia uniflora TaxID=39325 RepID=A0A7J7P9B5_9MAGN|nr:hypothetical protein GIB67_032622 [Kingdonia uniflora]
MLGTVATIAREEGLSALWKGIIPRLHRQCIYGGLRIGLYEPVKGLYYGNDFVGDVPLYKKFLVALTTVALAIAVANPTVVKVRALSTGIGHNIAQKAIINAVEIASYDDTKEAILEIPECSDNVLTHLLAGLAAGFNATYIGLPAEVNIIVDDYDATNNRRGTFCFLQRVHPKFWQGRIMECDHVSDSRAGGDAKDQVSFTGTVARAAFAACFAEICTIPLDTAKVRLQLQKKVVGGGDTHHAPKYRGMLGTVATIAREEGLSALWKGIIPGLHRQCIYGGLRIGLYEPVKGLYCGSDFVGDVPLSKKILAALTTGALAIAVANPTDLVKVRLQSEGKLPPGVPRKYSGSLNAYSTIVKQEGVRALWTGIGPNVARNAIINAAELASYDQVKETILKIPGFSDNVLTHLLAGLGAGFFAVCIGSPVDVVKSRMMGDSIYKNTFDCFIKTLKNDGPLAFYKGFIPNFGRLGSWNVIMFLTLEQAKKMFSKEA